MSNQSSQSEETGNFATGVILGSLLGGASLFFFGTKTGKKIHHELKNEFDSGNLDFKDLQEKTNQKLDQFFKTTNVSEQFQKFLTHAKPKTHASPKSTAKPKKRFFQKKGKTLG